MPDKQKPKKIIFNKKRLLSHPISIITTTLLFVALIGITSSNLVFLNTIRGPLTIQQATNSIYYQEYIKSYPIIILNIACISAIISNLSKRCSTIIKTGYIINIIITITLFFYLYSNNLRGGIAYYLILLINTILLLLPIKYSILEEEIEKPTNKETKYKEKNNKIENLSSKQLFTKPKTIITISIIII